MSDNKPEIRRWTLTLDIDNSDRYRKVSAAYYAVDKDSQLVEFKDSEHRVVLAVPAQRVLSIEGTDDVVKDIVVNNIVTEPMPGPAAAAQIDEAVRRQMRSAR